VFHAIEEESRSVIFPVTKKEKMDTREEVKL
jgi:hypothetical protein